MNRAFGTENRLFRIESVMKQYQNDVAKLNKGAKYANKDKKPLSNL